MFDENKTIIFEKCGCMTSSNDYFVCHMKLDVPEHRPTLSFSNPPSDTSIFGNIFKPSCDLCEDLIGNNKAYYCTKISYGCCYVLCEKCGDDGKRVAKEELGKWGNKRPANHETYKLPKCKTHELLFQDCPRDSLPKTYKFVAEIVDDAPEKDDFYFTPAITYDTLWRTVDGGGKC